MVGKKVCEMCVPVHVNDFESKTEKQNRQENYSRSRRKDAGSLVVGVRYISISEKLKGNVQGPNI